MKFAAAEYEGFATKIT